MKNWGVVLVLMTSFLAAAQETTQPAKTQSRKTISLSGTMSENGSVLLRDSEGKTWTVTNPELLQGYAGQEVTIHGQLLPENHELRVVSVKRVKREYLANWSDSAFRR